MKKILAVSLVGSLMIAVALTGCSSKPSTEEMKQLEDLRAEVASLEKEIATKESERASLQKAMTDKDAQLAQCAKDREALEQRMNAK
ncbi:MAG: hypothetical protein HYY49_13830 [Ignavibacteriales bacterium]|nr:hypothetical protein [Ignavibacteriales bacterium]